MVAFAFVCLLASLALSFLPEKKNKQIKTISIFKMPHIITLAELKLIMFLVVVKAGHNNLIVLL